MKPKRKIIIRADGNSEIGLGHITRCIALARILKNDFHCIFATRFLTETITRSIQEYCPEIITLSEDEGHLEEFLSYISPDITCVILDNYFFTTQYQEKIKNKHCLLVCIDDLYHPHYVADVVINYSPNATASKFSTEAYTKLVLGLNYILLREPFIGAQKTQKPLPSANTLNSAFVCFGGADPYNLTALFSKALSQVAYIQNIHVVTGAFYNHLPSLKKINSNKIKLYQNIDSFQMYDLISQSHISIVPISSLLWECISIGRPILTGWYAQNQQVFSDYVTRWEHVSILNLGNLLELSTANIADELQKIQEHYDFYLQNSSNQTLLIDGKTEERILSLFNELLP